MNIQLTSQHTYDLLVKSNLETSNSPYPHEPCLAKVVSVYDGDTFTCVIFNGEFVHWNVRMIGYDAPELRTGNRKEEGKECRDILRGMIDERIVVLIPSVKRDKYGRLLGEVMTYGKSGDVPFPIPDMNDKKWINVNQWMLNNTCVVPYDGGTKVQ